ncbi:hypothetical protein EBZ57_03655 [bacterium]|nr:hypothetical protein [bacterium]
MSSQDEKYALCYHATKKAMMNTYEDLVGIIQKGNPHNLPDPKLQLQFLSGWMQVIQGIEDSYNVDGRDKIKTIIN